MTKRAHCNAVAKSSGKRCTWPATCSDGKCTSHSSTPEARAIQAKRGRAGGKRNARPRVRVAVDTKTVAGLQTLVADLASELMASRADIIARCGVAARLVAEARALLDADVRAELEQIKAAIVQAAPHLAAQLGVAVPDGDEGGLQ